MIEFSCLNCGSRVSADDDDAGEHVECPGCTMTLRVPMPIGGRLTERRLAKPHAVPPQAAAMPIPVESTDTEQTLELESATIPSGIRKPAQPPEEPRNGFRIHYDFIGVYGRDQQPQLEDSILAICEAVQQHMEELPQFYRSCGLLIEVHLFDVQVGRIDIRLQVRGSLNGEHVSDSVLTHESPGGSDRSVLTRGVLGVAVANLANSVRGFVARESGIARAYRRAERLAVADLTSCLDALVDRS